MHYSCSQSSSLLSLLALDVVEIIFHYLANKMSSLPAGAVPSTVLNTFLKIMSIVAAVAVPSSALDVVEK